MSASVLWKPKEEVAEKTNTNKERKKEEKQLTSRAPLSTQQKRYLYIC